MSNWQDVIKADEIPSGEYKDFIINDIDILIVNLNGHYYAIENLCTHDGADLSSGEIEGDEIICPRHGARFCVKTGEVTCPPAYEDIEAFPTRVEDGMVQVLID